MQTAHLSVALPSVRHGREIVLLADLESHESGFGFVDAEHLLLAAVTLCAGMPRFRPVLDAHGVTPDGVRAGIRAFVGAHRPCPGEHDRVACTPAAARVLARAATIAGPLERVRPVHVVLAVLDGVDDPFMGSAHDVLDALGVDPRRFRRALRRAARRA
ncbi:Clp protease N-terminal domain-containing protein [Curtobacterium oceanosedimentum]|uniref:Clp protease N-terminal domain-containing protein n=1 Tax=Curtobacterium oceanosedimentum TaxID=465820 RepID=UPI001CE06947|nr:Clp protease N-terminal domain-containing protein [Curtobacterium oceanosedimentum]MCA5923127.1 Clp protease N-terminal domain-containing protein [Curtobacterium oceanosedimentum]